MNQSQLLSNCTADALLKAATNLRAGNLVAFPTETVYGLGADATNEHAIARIYSVKGRPSEHPLIVHISSMQILHHWADEIPVYAISLARDFWPGAMTLVMKRSGLAEDFITGGQETVGLRVPNHVVALALLEAFENIGGKGVAAPSANRFGHVSPTTAIAVEQELGEYLEPHDQIIDGGACAVGIESTIIDCTNEAPRVLRPGAITIAMIEQSTGLEVLEVGGNAIRVSGSLENHYSPEAKVILDVTPVAGQGLIALAQIETPSGVVRLAAPKSHGEFAQVLYSALRQADTVGLAEVVVQQPNGDGIAVAIRDRLARAANGR
jgi:L-threonylcarbamoyladenylate synthase